MGGYSSLVSHAFSPNNHTETIPITTLLGILAQASY